MEPTAVVTGEEREEEEEEVGRQGEAIAQCLRTHQIQPHQLLIRPPNFTPSPYSIPGSFLKC